MQRTNTNRGRMQHTGRYGPAEHLNERDREYCRQCQRLLAGWLAWRPPEQEHTA